MGDAMIDRSLLSEAKAGDVFAQWCLGDTYHSGKEVRRDYKKAAFWYRKAAEQGDSDSQFLLALLFDNGMPECDYEQAVVWYRKAAEQGHTRAQFRLADMYDEGIGVPEDFAQAAFWYRQAAELGEPDAQHSLAFAYANGRGVRKNCKKAAALYREAIENPNFEYEPDAQLELGILYRDGIKDFTQAAVWFRKAAAEDGDLEAFVNLADLYAEGLGVRRNRKQAVTWYLKAASLGNIRAAVKLGEAYAEGKGVRKSFADAYYHLTLAALEMDERERVIAEKKAAMAGANLTPAELSKASRRVKRHLIAKQLQEEQRILKLQKSPTTIGKKRVPKPVARNARKAGYLFR